MKQIFLSLFLAVFLTNAASLFAEEISPELKEKIKSYWMERDTIRKEIKDRIRALGEVSREEKNQSISEWRKQNKQKIATLKKFGDDIKTQIKEIIQVKKNTLKGLPALKRQEAMQKWYMENSQYLSVMKKRGTVTTATQDFRSNINKIPSKIEAERRQRQRRQQGSHLPKKRRKNQN